MSVDVEVVRDGSHELVNAFGRFLPQLSRSAKPLDAEAIRLLVGALTLGSRKSAR